MVFRCYPVTVLTCEFVEANRLIDYNQVSPNSRKELGTDKGAGKEWLLEGPKDSPRPFHSRSATFRLYPIKGNRIGLADFFTWVWLCPRHFRSNLFPPLAKFAHRKARDDFRKRDLKGSLPRSTSIKGMDMGTELCQAGMGGGLTLPRIPYQIYSLQPRRGQHNRSRKSLNSTPLTKWTSVLVLQWVSDTQPQKCFSSQGKQIQSRLYITGLSNWQVSLPTGTDHKQQQYQRFHWPFLYVRCPATQHIMQDLCWSFLLQYMPQV